MSLRLEGRWATVFALMAAFFPADVPTGDPELALVFASGRAFEGRLEETASYLDVARRLAGSVSPARRPRFDALMAGVSPLQAGPGGVARGLEAARRHLEQALELARRIGRHVARDRLPVASGQLGSAQRAAGLGPPPLTQQRSRDRRGNRMARATG